MPETKKPKANAVKFDFQSLHAPTPGASGLRETAPRKRLLSEQQIQEIQAASYSEGFNAGEAATLSHIEKECADSLLEITSQFSSLCEQVNGHMALIRSQAAELALTIANLLTPALIAREPYTEIEALFKACVSSLNAEPRIVIRAGEPLVQGLKARIDNAAQQAGYPGRIVIIGDPDAHNAYCRIEWADGGVSRQSPEQLNEINSLIARYIEHTSREANATSLISDITAAHFEGNKS